MSYVHRIWTTASPTRHRILQVMLIALLACTVSAALIAYSAQQPIRTQPTAPEIALPRNEASLPDVYWDAFRPETPAVTLPQADASQRDHYWDSFRLNNED